MTGCGYRYTRARNLPEKSILHSRERGAGYYTKEYATDAGNFNVALVIHPDPFTELPTAFIIEQPEQFKSCLMPMSPWKGSFAMLSRWKQTGFQRFGSDI